MTLKKAKFRRFRINLSPGADSIRCRGRIDHTKVASESQLSTGNHYTLERSPKFEVARFPRPADNYQQRQGDFQEYYFREISYFGKSIYFVKM